MIGVLADASMRSLFVAALAGLVILVYRRGTAAFRHAVWTAVLAAMLLIPALTGILPPVFVRVLAPVKSIATRAMSAQPASEATRASGVVPLAPASTRFNWRLIALTAHAGIAALMLARLAVGLWRVRGLRRRSAPVQAGGAIIYVSPEIAVPLTVGVFRPGVLLPAAWGQWCEAKLAAVLAHERAHISRRDPVVAFVAEVNRAIQWWNPLAWWLCRRLAALAEEACDDVALSATGDRRKYARVLLDMAEDLRAAGGRVGWAATGMATQSEVARRIGLVLDERRSLIHSGGAPLAVVFALLPLTGIAAAVRFAPQEAPPASAPLDDMELLGAGYRMSPAEVEAAERQIKANPEETALRAKLLSHYFQFAERGPYVEHLFWLIEHHPESPVFETRAALLPRPPVPLVTQEDYERGKTLWLDQVRRHPDDPRVISHAVDALRGDFPAAEDLLLRSRAAHSEQAQLTRMLANLYAGALASVPPPRGADPVRILDNLRASMDAELVGIAGLSMRGSAATLLQNARDLSDEELKKASANLTVAKELLDRARSLAAGDPRWSDGVPGGVPGGISGGVRGGIRAGVSGGVSGPAAMRIRVGPDVQASKLRKKIDPVYPPLARQARIQGTVRFVVVIGTDGRLTHAELISGHPLLVPAAQAAVIQYEYQPTLLDGIPVEVTTEVSIPFNL